MASSVYTTTTTPPTGIPLCRTGGRANIRIRSQIENQLFDINHRIAYVLRITTHIQSTHHAYEYIHRKLHKIRRARVYNFEFIPISHGKSLLLLYRKIHAERIKL